MFGIARLGIIGVLLAYVTLLGRSTNAGILDQFNWARADRIEVNLPWLPCKFFFLMKSAIISTHEFYDIDFYRQLKMKLDAMTKSAVSTLQEAGTILFIDR